MSRLVIRQGTEQDVDAIAEMENICFTLPWSRRSIEEEFTSNRLAIYMVAEWEGRLVGYAGVWLIANEGHITNVAVRPEYRNRHIAAAMISALLEASERKGAVQHTLEVRRSNSIARNLYRKFGFLEAGVRPGYYQDNGEDAVIMWRAGQSGTGRGA